VQTVITADNATECEGFVWSTELSELGHKPGETIPAQFSTNLGNKLDFLYESSRRCGETLVLTYRQVAGCLKLDVYND
jgi:hypothetical protein